MKQGDFTRLAKDYVNRPGYSLAVLEKLSVYTGVGKNGSVIADVGAGTGKLTENLLELGYENIIAVEPNDAMREEGVKSTNEKKISWIKGSGEDTGLANNSVDWVFMASSFHWTDPEKSLPEFKRILKPGGFLTVLWNPRDLDDNPLQKKIEALIHEWVPGIKRVSSGSARYTKGIEEKLIFTNDFKDVFFFEAGHEILMTRERYIGAWRSVNDVQAQAGKEKFEMIIKAIEKEVEDVSMIVMPYKTRSWTAKVNK